MSKRPSIEFSLACMMLCLLPGRVLAHEDNAETQVLSLAGEWRFAADLDKKGLEQQFFARELAGTIRLPGSTDEAKIGPNTSKPNLDGLYRLYKYEGPAWYQRQIQIPAGWKGKQVSLFLERVHWETRVWLDDRYIGARDTLIAPHVYDLGTNLKPGPHRLTICVDNTLKFNLGEFVSILYEGTQTNWNGIIGKLELRADDPVSIADVQVYPNVERKVAKVRVTIANSTGKASRGTLSLAVPSIQSIKIAFVTAGEQTVVNAELPLGPNPKLWDEFSPSLYDLTVSLAAKPGYRGTKKVTFGMRGFSTQGTQFTMNGRPLFLRGTLECGIFPRTGYPPTDVESWRRIYRIIKSYGLNFIRFHSWCPPEAAFSAADQEGIMIQAEGPQANVDAGADLKRDAFVEGEFLRIVRTYGNHPSFCLMTLGNEYGGPDQILSRWIDMLIKEDPRHLYSTPSAGGKTTNRQFTENLPRGIHGPGTDADFHVEISKEDRPLIGHEIGQWTFYPNFEETQKYTGVLAAKNFDLVHDDLARKNMLDLAPRFFEATGKQAVLLYKEEIEVLLRTAGHAGFSLLDMHDYPGQGTALIGPLDPFWDSKGLVKPEVHRQYCGSTVPLLRMKKRTFTTDESFTATVDIAHFGPRDIENAQPHWSLRDEQGREVASGSLPSTTVPTGRLTPLGSIETALGKAPAPAKLTMTVSLAGTEFANQWDIWVYPSATRAAAPLDVVVATDWDDTAKSALAAGKKVVLFPHLRKLAHALPGQFLPVFWSPIWFPDQRPNTMGILCDPRHPALAQFPTDTYSNWQWYDLIQNSRSIILDETPAAFRPVVQVIDNLERNHKLGVLFEARVGEGSLLVSAIDLPAIAGKQPAARQLLASLYSYAGSAAFHPAQELPAALLDKILESGSASLMQKLGATIVSADSQTGTDQAENLLDGDPISFWHTQWGDPVSPFPHQVVIGFPQPVRLAGVVCLPRRRTGGWIKGYEIQLSDDGTAWRKTASGEFDHSGSAKTVRFAQPESARFLKFVALSDFEGKPYASLAELTVIPAQ